VSTVRVSAPWRELAEPPAPLADSDA